MGLVSRKGRAGETPARRKSVAESDARDRRFPPFVATVHFWWRMPMKLHRYNRRGRGFESHRWLSMPA